MLGSVRESDDALHEARLRIRDQDPAAVENMQASLTTVVGRVSLNTTATSAPFRGGCDGMTSAGCAPMGAGALSSKATGSAGARRAAAA